MYLAHVIGTVVCTKKADNMQGLKLLVVEPCDPARKPIGDVHVAVDAVALHAGGAGPGDLVTCVGSREAALAVQPSFVPVDAAIIGIVDHADYPAAPTVRS